MLEPAVVPTTAVSFGVESASLVDIVGCVLLRLTMEELAAVPLIATSWRIAAPLPFSSVASLHLQRSTLTSSGIYL